MKYGKRIVRIAIDNFPYEKVIGREKEDVRRELFINIKSIEPNRDGIFGDRVRWRIKIHYILNYVKISYFPIWPSRKGRIYYSWNGK